MIRHIYILSVVIQLLFLPVVVAQPNDSLAVNPDRTPLLSGFVDVRGVYSSDPDKTSKFSIGQAELDLEQTGFAVRNWFGFAGRIQDGGSLRDNPNAE